MKIKVTFDKIFDAVEYTMTEEWSDCTFEQFKDHLVMSFQDYPEEIVDEIKFEEIKE